MRRLLICCALVAVLSSSGLRVEGAPLVELEDREGKYVGRIMAFDDEQLWLQEQNGSLRLMEKEKIRGFKQLSGNFRLMSGTDLRGELRRELGTGLEVRGTGHYLVCGDPQSVDRYAQVFEDVYRSFFSYFSVRGIRLEEPDQPLVGIVLPSQKKFAEYALRDGIQAGRGLGGYYIRTTNRVALYEEDSRAELDLRGRDAGEEFLPARERPIGDVLGGWLSEGAFATIEGNLRDTIVHEVTHQMAFNTGVHNRMAENPKWFVEGLACVFEAPGIRQADPSGKVSTRINAERLGWFNSYRKVRRPEKFLKEFVSSDNLFAASPLDAYAEGWALTFFLIETRRREYGTYIRKVAARKPLEEYTAEERVQDFEGAFGKDWVGLETAYLRYIDGLR